jgi:hypothetical protein
MVLKPQANQPDRAIPAFLPKALKQKPQQAFEQRGRLSENASGKGVNRGLNSPAWERNPASKTCPKRGTPIIGMAHEHCPILTRFCSTFPSSKTLEFLVDFQAFFARL